MIGHKHRARVKGLKTFLILTTFVALGTWLFYFGAGPDTAVAQPTVIPATFADVAAKASPAVVNISTEKVVHGGPKFPIPQDRGGEQGDPFQEFFERFFGDRMPRGDRKERSLGSGFIIDPSGLTITNNHVVEDADEIKVMMADGREFKAEILGRDPKTDLALIKIKGDGKFPFLRLGDSSQVRIGDWVVAIGNPFGLEHTVTVGILSARGRAIGAGPYDDFLQTDASINPGNSGGPLLNLDGEVIGINTAIVAGGGGGSTGIGFAIPTKLAKKIVSQLRDQGRVVRGWLGVMIQKITPELAKSFGLDSEQGALVADVAPGGPAEKAGIKRGDVILEFNGQNVEEWSDLPGIVADTPVGAKVKVKIIRDGREKIFDVAIGELEDEETVVAQTDSRDLGLTVEPLSEEVAKRLGLSETEGVIITGMTTGSAAEESGLKPGDLILEINRQPIKNMEDYRRIVKDLKKGDTVLFLIRRGANTLFFTLEAD